MKYWVAKINNEVAVKFKSLPNKGQLIALASERSTNVVLLEVEETALYAVSPQKQLTDRDLESLRQYANECKMRPSQYPDEWRRVPTSNAEFFCSGEQEYWRTVASQF